ncbi:hypothetical protein GGR71_003905 [Xanthomonas sp. F1]
MGKEWMKKVPHTPMLPSDATTCRSGFSRDGRYRECRRG